MLRRETASGTIFFRTARSVNVGILSLLTIHAIRFAYVFKPINKCSGNFDVIENFQFHEKKTTRK